MSLQVEVCDATEVDTCPAELLECTTACKTKNTNIYFNCYYNKNSPKRKNY